MVDVVAVLLHSNIGSDSVQFHAYVISFLGAARHHELSLTHSVDKLEGTHTIIIIILFTDYLLSDYSIVFFTHWRRTRNSKRFYSTVHSNDPVWDHVASTHPHTGGMKVRCYV